MTIKIPADPPTGTAATVASAAPGLQSTTSTALVPLTTTVTVVFVAPPSGKVLLYMNCSIYSSSNSAVLYIGAEARTGGTIGSGTVILAFTDSASLTNSLQSVGGSRTTPLTGLTPGSSYNARILVQLSAVGTGYIANAGLVASPLLV